MKYIFTLLMVLSSIMNLNVQTTSTYICGNNTFTITESTSMTFIKEESVYNASLKGTSPYEYFVERDFADANKKMIAVINKVFRESNFNHYPFVVVIDYAITNNGNLKNIKFAIPNEYKEALSMPLICELYNALMNHTIEGRGNFGDDTVKYMKRVVKLKSKP